VGSGQVAERQTRPTERRDLPSLTWAELQPFVSPVEAACQTHRADWRLDGRPRTARRYTPDTTGPWPTPEDRRLFLLSDLHTSPLHVVQGRLFGRGQSTAHQGMHVLVVGLRVTRRALGEAPTRSVQALAQRLGGPRPQPRPWSCRRRAPRLPPSHPRRRRLLAPPWWARGDGTAPRAPPGSDGANARCSRPEQRPDGANRVADRRRAGKGFSPCDVSRAPP
jgi:hypothetical protein